MRLVIAEKPSVGRAIAHVLPRPHRVERGAIHCNDGTTVTWCVGHLLEPAEPETYDPRWARWSLDSLPIFPDRWQLTPKTTTQDQLQHVLHLLREATHVIHAGDPDREGQLLVDEVLQFGGWTQHVDRLLINDMNPDAIQLALVRLRNNADFHGLSRSALARQQSDWLYGINLTRAYTLKYRHEGHNGVYSVGRVQTPVLGLVVARDLLLEGFESQAYYSVTATLATKDGRLFEARWVPGSAVEHLCDDEGRLRDRRAAEYTAARLNGQPASVISADSKTVFEAPPLPFSLSGLQIAAARELKFSAQQTLDVAQALYEKHKAITYPRSDCRYLPSGHFESRHTVLSAIHLSLPEHEHTQRALALIQVDLRGAVWNDDKVNAHHAIIPTQRKLKPGTLNADEQGLYQLIARHYLLQFMPAATYRDTRVRISCGGEVLRASHRAAIDAGWTVLQAQSRDNEATSLPLPPLAEHDPLNCVGTNLREHATQPPPRFSDASLIEAMAHIARYVADPLLKKTLRETDGLGTEATRAAVIETLIRREYLRRDARHLISTPKGRELISALPDAVITPDMTAVWESALDGIQRQAMSADAFLVRLQKEVLGLLAPLLPERPQPSRSASLCPLCGAPMTTREGKFGAFLSCAKFPACKGTRKIPRPVDVADGPPIPCPSCHAPLARRDGEHGAFWGCSNYPSCRVTLPDIDGRPRIDPDSPSAKWRSARMPSPPKK